jgi:hypothetical protein
LVTLSLQYLDLFYRNNNLTIKLKITREYGNVVVNWQFSRGLLTIIEAIDRAIDPGLFLFLHRELLDLQRMKALLSAGVSAASCVHLQQRCAFMPRPAFAASSHRRGSSRGNVGP